MQAIGSFVEWMSATPWNAPDLGYDPPLPRRSLVRALIVAAGWFSAIEVNGAEPRRLARQVIDIDPEESWGYSLQAMASFRSEPPADVFEWACAGVSAARNDITRLTWARYAQAWAAVRKGPADAARAVATGFQDWATAARSNIAVTTAATVMVLLEWRENPALALSHAEAGLRAARTTMARSPEHLLDAMRIKLLIELSLPDAQDAAHEVLDNYRRSGDHQLLLFQLALTTVVLQRLGNVEAAARVAGQVDLPHDRPLLAPVFAVPFDDSVAALRIGLGASYERLYQEGASMDVMTSSSSPSPPFAPLAAVRTPPTPSREGIR